MAITYNNIPTTGKWGDAVSPIEDNFSRTSIELARLDVATSTLAVIPTFKDPVPTFNALATTYPTPENGWSAMVEDVGFIYQYNGTAWANTGLTAFPTDVLRVTDLTASVNSSTVTAPTNKAVYSSLSGKADTTFILGDSLPQTVKFGNMVRAIYTTGKTLTSTQSLRIVYFGIESTDFQSYPFGIMIALRENGSNTKHTKFIYPYKTDLKNNAILKLSAPISGSTTLSDEGLSVYVVLSDQFESLYTPSFDSTVINITQEGSNWYLNPLLKKYITDNYVSKATYATDQENIGDTLVQLNSNIASTNTTLSAKIESTATGGNTYKVTLPNAAVDVFKTYVGEIYITGLNDRANRKFRLAYYGAGQPGYTLLIQISVRNVTDTAWENAANYTISGTLQAGSTYKLSTTDTNAKQGVNVYLRTALSYVTPPAIAPLFIGAYVELTPLAWNNFISIPIQKQLTDIAGGNVTEIIVSADINDTEAQFKGANAIQLAINSITDASPTNRYRIYVKQGIFKITNSSQFIGNPSYPAMIVPKNYVDILGQSREDCLVSAELPYNDIDIDTAISRNLHQTMYNWANDCTVENLKLVSKYIRYTLHQDNANETNGERRYKNCGFEFLGDKGYDNALGIGTYSGSRTFVEGGYSKAYTHPPVAIHNNQNFKKPSEWHFKEHEFINSKGGLPGFIYMSVCGSLVSDKLNLTGCSFGSSIVFNYMDNWIYTPNKTDSFNHAEWRVTGYGNDPFYFRNELKGLSLRIDAIDGYRNIRVDNTSTAYASLLKNPHSFFGHLGHPERYVLDGHIVFDSYQLTKGYIIGGLSIYEGTYPNGTTQSVDGLGKRLGDCSVTNKELRLTVGNDAVTVTFNKNYTNMSNASIIAEINTALGTYAVASEYNISLDYYPEMNDVMSICVNGTNSIISKGTPLSLSKDRVIPATDSNQIFGIALDDFVPFNEYQGIVRGYGRVLKRGYISTNNNIRHYANMGSLIPSVTRIINIKDNDTTIEVVGINI